VRYDRLKHFFQQRAVVLCYHRVAAPLTDPWELCVHPRHFAEQLQILQELDLAVSLQVLMEDLHQKRVKKGVAITFDDGYIDNYNTAMPLLMQYGIPATFFITSRNIGSLREFWWDELEKITLLTPLLPQQLAFDYNGQRFFFDLQHEVELTDALLEKHKHFSAYRDAPTLRTQLYIKLWQVFSPLTQSQQDGLMEVIRKWAGITEHNRDGYECMTAAAVSRLSANTTFSIGGHTSTHPALKHHEKEVQEIDIMENKQYLEKLTNKTINTFAYPSGSYNQHTIEVLKEGGFKAAFTTQAKPVFKDTNPFTIGRLQAPNCNGKEFKKFLSKWFQR
jgi:peptidoglycan/xylan/chitin deacetylase (PgdA/CDA1 family)